MSLARLRIALWVVVGLVAIGGILLALLPRSPNLPSASETPLTNIGGRFTLTGGDGKPFSSEQLHGWPAAIFFGFTHCPDVCPTTLARLAKLRRQLGKGDDGFAIVFITVDPERDGPAEVGAYTGLFGTPVIGLSGKPAEIDRV